ncbi:carboxypeptidase SOL1 isoform X2 [Lycium ferocissimum]|uniref:carboxypeptidase SOL1 isoform X2 n=1 Tax=Lycium ferocissimum TaxID=112874 RepID=UPI002815C61C|nr:carboxypeptidase SOL1 isoform X2 [Lycium ferocissimum]
MNLFFFFLFSLLFSSLFNLSFARGGFRSSINVSGVVNGSFAASARHLFADINVPFSEEQHLKRLEELAKDYMSNSELENAIMSLNRRCSKISRVYSIGKSVLGVPLWVMEISDKPGKEEAEPSFKYIGNVHGDEPVGRELLILLANWLCDNYMKDPLATLIVDNVHLHILPSMNPDGFSLRRRGNANNVDLNRDFPDQFFPMNDDPGAHQPETKAIMRWLEEMQFTASASLHGGALVANYPWDGTENKKKYYYGCPDDETFRHMASIYSHSHHNMSLSEEFPGGITNGAYWYPIYGGMQDWNYLHASCFELTLEISDDKWPNASETGIHGRIFSSDEGRPLPASIAIKGINSTIHARETLADYHRLLVPGGKYEVVATMPGYKSRSTKIMLGEEAMTVDFVMDPVITPTNSFLQRGWSCSLPGPHLEVFFILVLVLVSIFLCFLLKRRVVLNYLKQRQTNRSVVGV